MKTLLSIVAFVWFGISNASAATWYCSPTGSDSNTGTIQAPFATIKAALNKAQSGDVIQLYPGQYRGGFKITRSNITINGGDGVRIVASITDSAIGSAIEIEYTTDGTILKNLDVAGGYFYGIKTNSSWSWGSDYLPYTGATNVQILNCTVHDSGTDCIKLTPGGNNCQIIGCTIFNSGVRDPSNAQAIDGVNVDDLLISRCTINNCRSGLIIKGGSERTTIERCLLTNIDAGHAIMLGQDTDVDWFKAENKELWESIDGTVRNCIVQHCRGAGLAAQAALNAKFFNNTLLDVAYDDSVNGYNCGGLMVAGVDHYLPPKYNTATPKACRDVTFINNIVEVKSTRPCFKLRNIQDTIGGCDGTCVLWANAFNKVNAVLNQTALVIDQQKTIIGLPTFDVEYRPASVLSGLASIVLDDYYGQPRGIRVDVGAVLQKVIQITGITVQRSDGSTQVISGLIQQIDITKADGSKITIK